MRHSSFVHSHAIVAGLLAALLSVGSAAGQEALPPGTSSQHQGTDGSSISPDQLPRVSVAESPWGLPARGVFAGLTAKGVAAEARQLSSALMLGGAPVDRLMFHALLTQKERHFAPIVAGQLRLAGEAEGGPALGILAQYKAEGFTELGGELEAGLAAGLQEGRFSARVNLISGLGVEGDERGQVDGEVRLHAAWTLLPELRLGGQGQVRTRLAGTNLLPGGKTWDVHGGPQVVWSPGTVFLALSAGPTTQGVAQGVGSFGQLTFVVAIR